MTHSQQYVPVVPMVKLCTAMRLAALLCILSIGMPARAQVGMVLTVEGQVNVISGKPECGLRYGLDLDEGDTVRTGDKSWAVLSLMDGAKITVRPSTEARIETYRFVDSGDPAQNQALLSLARGSLRVATGAIVRGRNSGYRIRTPEVTLEMRGTDHEIVRMPPSFSGAGEAGAGSYGKTFAGEALIRSASGDLALRDGQSAFAASRGSAAPRLLTYEPWFFSVNVSIDRRAAAIVDALSGPNIPQ